MSSELPPIALRVEEPGKEPELFEYEDKKMIKIGRGSRKGIDLQLEDKAVARMHAVIHVRSTTDLFVMDMGSAGGTFVDDKKTGAKGKVKSKSVIKVGETLITVYVGDDIPQPEPVSPPTLPDAAAPQAGEGGMMPPPLPPLDGGMPAPSPVATQAPLAVTEPPTTFNLAMPYNPNYVLHPVQQTPCASSGVLTPQPTPFPSNSSEAGAHLLLEVVERLGRQQWYREDKVW